MRITRNSRTNNTLGTVMGDWRNLCKGMFPGDRKMKNACINLGQANDKGWKRWWIANMNVGDYLAKFKKLLCAPMPSYHDDCTPDTSVLPYPITEDMSAADEALFALGPGGEAEYPPGTEPPTTKIAGFSIIQIVGITALTLGAVFAFKKKKKKRK